MRLTINQLILVDDIYGKVNVQRNSVLDQGRILTADGKV